jgi:hypothetical protein
VVESFVVIIDGFLLIMDTTTNASVKANVQAYKLLDAVGAAQKKYVAIVLDILTIATTYLGDRINSTHLPKPSDIMQDSEKRYHCKCYPTSYKEDSDNLT